MDWPNLLEPDTTVRTKRPDKKSQQAIVAELRQIATNIEQCAVPSASTAWLSHALTMHGEHYHCGTTLIVTTRYRGEPLPSCMIDALRDVIEGRYYPGVPYVPIGQIGRIGELKSNVPWGGQNGW